MDTVHLHAFSTHICLQLLLIVFFCVVVYCILLYFILSYFIVACFYPVPLSNSVRALYKFHWLIDWLTDWLIDWCYCAKSCGDENIVVGQIICKIVTADFIPAAFSVVTDTVKIVQPRRLLLGHENVASSVVRCCQAVVWTNSWLCCCNG